MEDDQLDLMSSLQIPVQTILTNAEEDDDGLQLSSSLQLRSSLAATVRPADGNLRVSAKSIDKISTDKKIDSPASKLHNWLDAQQRDSHVTATSTNVLSPPTEISTERTVNKQVLEDISEFKCALKSDNTSEFTRAPDAPASASKSKPRRKSKPEPQLESAATSTLPVHVSPAPGTPSAQISTQPKPTTVNTTSISNNLIFECFV